MDLDKVERDQYLGDCIYEECRLYKFRQCHGCKQERLPKSSHCSACDHCVVDRDHHSNALNNCIGRRNIRAYVLLLVTSFLLAMEVLLSCLFFLIIGHPHWGNSDLRQRIGAVFATLLICLFLRTYPIRWAFYTQRAFKPKQLVFMIVVYVMSAVASVGSVFGLIMYILVAFSSIYLFLIREVVIEYLDLVSRKMTVKERSAR